MTNKPEQTAAEKAAQNAAKETKSAATAAENAVKEQTDGSAEDEVTATTQSERPAPVKDPNSRTYKGDGVVWDAVKDQPLVTFIKGQAVVSDKAAQKTLDDLGYKYE